MTSGFAGRSRVEALASGLENRVWLRAASTPTPEVGVNGVRGSAGFASLPKDGS